MKSLSKVLSLALIIFMLTMSCTCEQVKQANIHEVLLNDKAERIGRIVLTLHDHDILHVEMFQEYGDQNIESLVVIDSAVNNIPVQRKEEGQVVTFETSKLIVELDKETGLLTFSDKFGDNYLVQSGFHIVKDSTYADYKSVGISFRKDSSEAIYGLGHHEEGYMNYQDKKITLVQQNTKTSVPFHISSRGYGLLWDNYSPTQYDFTGNNYSISSNLGYGINFYFIAGENADSIIKGYRKLTGDAPLLPKWGYGYWQSRERYKTREELLNVATKIRNRNFPCDLIIQDWQYWGKNPWNALVFDPEIFPEPENMVEILHDRLQMKFMIVVWARFQKGSEAYKKLKESGYLYPDIDTSVLAEMGDWAQEEPLKGMVLATYYDVYNPGAREMYWEMIKEKFFDIGTDAWWVDAPEPDLVDMADYQTYLGPGAYYHNTYPLMHAKGIYDGQRGVTDEKRVVQLIRSSFAGQQRFGVVPWSGDVLANWENLGKQVTGALNFCMSGIPYWTSDIGGFFIWDYDDPNNNPEYKELYTRWFQFGTFCPVFRSHGSNAPREPWKFGDQTEKTLFKYAQLRYRLLPYIYSTAWQVTSNQYTMMRGLYMDYPSDSKVYEIDDQYMFGPSLLVCPVTSYGQKSREVYLPGSTDWYDFYTYQQYDGGQPVEAAAPVDKIPVFVKAGSILPFGPVMQHVGEKEVDTLDIIIFRGADGLFTLYDDEDDSYNYEKGMYSVTEFHWSDAAGELTIGERKGKFPGMKDKMVFNIQIIGMEGVEKTMVINYTGKEINLNK